MKQIKCESGTKHLVTYFIFYFFRESQIELRQQIDLVAEGNIHSHLSKLFSNFQFSLYILKGKRNAGSKL